MEPPRLTAPSNQQGVVLVAPTAVPSDRSNNFHSLSFLTRYNDLWHDPEEHVARSSRTRTEYDMGKRHYKRSDMILREMIAAGLTTETEIELSQFDKVRLKDKLENDILFFHGSYARRFELERVKT